MGSHMMSLGMLRRFALASVGLLALVIATPARADDALAKPRNATAQQRLAAGNKLYRVREFDKAVDEYKAGALVEDVPVFHYNLGQCYRQLGRYDDAIWHYERFLDRSKPTGEVRAAVDAFVTQMKSELAKKAMTQPPTDPAPIPDKPLSEPKTHTVVEPGERWYADAFGWGLAGAGAIGVGTSIGLILNAKALDDDANNEPNQEVRNSLRDRAETRRLTGTIVGAFGVAAFAAGAIKLVIYRKARERTVTTSWNIGVGRDSIFLLGRF